MADDDFQSIIDAINAGPDGGAAAAQFGGQQGKQRYIGVPDDYAVTRSAGTAGSAANFRSAEMGDTSRIYTPGGVPANVTPRYVTGSEYRMRSLSPERIAQLQQTLATAGLIGKKQVFRVGVWDETSAAAYRKVLAYANQGGIDEDTALAEIQYHADTGQGALMFGDGRSADGTTGTQGRVQHLTPAVTLEEQVQQSAQNRLGRKLRKNEVDKFVSIYSGIEKHTNAQEITAADDAAQGIDSTVTDPPSIDVAASQYLDHGFAQEEAGQHAYGFLDIIKRMVG